MTENKSIAVNHDAPLSAKQVQDQINAIQEVMAAVMKPKTHYGIIPGCGNKPVLFKAGAEKLQLTFCLRQIINPIGDIIMRDLPNGHREYTVYCHILTMSGIEKATGVGFCSTMESKYRYRNASDYEITEDKIPADAREKKTEYRKLGYGMKFVDDKWQWVKYTSDGKVENPDIADTYNTVMKIAVKRAYVPGILSATGASDIFIQEIEDSDMDVTKPEEKKPKPSTPKPIAKDGEKIVGINEKFNPVKEGKQTCTISIGGQYYLANVSKKDVCETMQKSEGQEVELTVTPSDYNGKTYYYIDSIIVNVEAELV